MTEAHIRTETVTPKERPLLFSAPMVHAILAGQKTQTRRAIKQQPIDILPMQGEKAGVQWITLEQKEPEPKGRIIRCRYGAPGDRLWVRETFRIEVRGVRATGEKFDAAVYRADSTMRPEFDPLRWKPSIHMPRWASRLTLEIVAVRAQRLQEISERDCCAEGCGSPITRDCKKPKFRELWESINGAGSWDANPWIWAIEFKRVTS
jgi:hypothetical protein